MSDDERFPPVEGGRVDTARKAAAAADDVPETVEVDDGPVQYSAVRVRPEPPDTGTAVGVNLSASNPVLRLFAADRQRRTAVVIAVDNDVYISHSQDAALAAAGSASATGIAYLPAGLGIPVDNQAELWVAATTLTGNSRVSLFISKDSAL